MFVCAPGWARRRAARQHARTQLAGARRPWRRNRAVHLPESRQQKANAQAARPLGGRGGATRGSWPQKRAPAPAPWRWRRGGARGRRRRGRYRCARGGLCALAAGQRVWQRREAWHVRVWRRVSADLQGRCARQQWRTRCMRARAESPGQQARHHGLVQPQPLLPMRQAVARAPPPQRRWRPCAA
eukprot:scaffold8455_cov104-Isochrysis_galbana.AAC.5